MLKIHKNAVVCYPKMKRGPMNQDEKSPPLSCVSTEEIKLFMESYNFPAFRAKQLHEWIYKRFTFNPDLMNNLPLVLRETLKTHFLCNGTTLAERCQGSDGTAKMLLKLHDGNLIEAVEIPSRERMTFCLSSQVGCPVRCAFCASGAEGLTRHLSAGEILEQFMLLVTDTGKMPTNLVFMGIGEPLLNFDALSLAIERLTSSDYIGFSPRRITVSTSGITKGIAALAALDKPLYLALSLHATDDLTRSHMIPDAFREPIKDILIECEKFMLTHNRLVTLEYTLIKGLNDHVIQARELAQIAIKLRAKVNLIAYNSVENSNFKRPDTNTIYAFAETVERAGAMVTVRMSKGNESSAACGQLRATRQK